MNFFSALNLKRSSAEFFYVYDGDGNIVRSIDISGKKEYNYEYEEGRIVRATEADIELSGGEEETLEAVRAAVENTLCSLRENWEEEAVTVRISALVSGMLAAEGVADVRNVTLNGKTENLLLDSGQVPVFDPENSQFHMV